MPITNYKTPLRSEASRLKKHGDHPLKQADDRHVVDYETVILRRPKRNEKMLARLIAMVSMG